MSQSKRSGWIRPARWPASDIADYRNPSLSAPALSKGPLGAATHNGSASLRRPRRRTKLCELIHRIPRPSRAHIGPRLGSLPPWASMCHPAPSPDRICLALARTPTKRRKAFHWRPRPPLDQIGPPRPTAPLGRTRSRSKFELRRSSILWGAGAAMATTRAIGPRRGGFASSPDRGGFEP